MSSPQFELGWEPVTHSEKALQAAIVAQQADETVTNAVIDNVRDMVGQLAYANGLIEDRAKKAIQRQVNSLNKTVQACTAIGCSGVVDIVTEIDVICNIIEDAIGSTDPRFFGVREPQEAAVTLGQTRTEVLSPLGRTGQPLITPENPSVAAPHEVETPCIDCGKNSMGGIEAAFHNDKGHNYWNGGNEFNCGYTFANRCDVKFCPEGTEFCNSRGLL